MAEELVSFNPGWISNKDNLLINDNLNKIFNFYLFSTPCLKTSSSGVTMQNRGWSNNVWKTNSLRNYLLNIANLNSESYIKVKKLDDMTNALARIRLNNNFQSHRDSNKICFLSKGNSEFLDIFFYIRCAFAHGRFQIYANTAGESTYVLEAIKKKKTSDTYSLRARMILKESTLIEWADIIMGGDDSLVEATERQHTLLRKEIVNIISNKTKRISKQDIVKSLCVFEVAEIKQQINVLRDRNQIKYNNRSKSWEIIQ